MVQRIVGRVCVVNRMHHNHKTHVFIYFSNRIINTALNSAFVRCTEDKKRRTAHTQTQLGQETTSASVPSRLIHTSLPHCVTVLLSFCSLCKSTISVHDEFFGRPFKISHCRRVLKCRLQCSYVPVTPPYQIPCF